MAYVYMVGAFILATPVISCDKVEYAEAKTWSTAKLQKAYCDDLTENFQNLKANLEGVAGYDRQAAELCRQQTALYKRLLEARGKDQLSCRPAG